MKATKSVNGKTALRTRQLETALAVCALCFAGGMGMESYGGPQRDFEKKLATVSDAAERRDSVPLQEYFRQPESMKV